MLAVFCLALTCRACKICFHTLSNQQEINLLEKKTWSFPKEGLEPIKHEGRSFYSCGNGKNKILFFGDSNIEQYASRIVYLFKKNKNSTKQCVFSTAHGKLPLGNTFYDKDDLHIDFFDNTQMFIKREKFNTIVLGSRWNIYYRNKNFYYLNEEKERIYFNTDKGQDFIFKEIESTMRNWTSQGIKVYLILPMPNGDKCDPKNFFKRNFIGQWFYLPTSMSLQEWKDQSEELVTRLKKAAGNSGAQVIDPTLHLCNENSCITTFQDTFVYADACHLNTDYVRDHVTFLDFLINE